tara:strand:+ start:1053 stop:2246 length:1194 start_codon:yes stop_codon:yes gene_type:complete
LGTEKFGLLTLFWAVIGYANIFELGLGRAITKKLAAQLDADAENTEIISTSLILSVVLSLLGIVLIGTGFTALFEDVIGLSQDLFPDTTQSITYLLYAMPLLIAGPILVGVLEAHRRFLVIATIRVPSGIALFAVPAALTLYSQDVSTLILGMLVVRVLTVAAQLWTVLRVVDLVKGHFTFHWHHCTDLLSYGGWLTVSAVIGPLLVYMDRFLLASMQDLIETGIYTIPFEGVVRFLVVPSAIVGVMFPRFVVLYQSRTESPRPLYRETMLYVLALVTPLCLIMFVFGQQILSYWLGVTEVAQMAVIAQILAVAVMINAVGHVSQGYIQAAGLASWTGKLHVCELIVYFLYMPWLISQFGANGAATGWLVRVMISTIALYWLANYVIRRDEKQKGIS